MEQNDVISLIAMETAEPKRKLNRSAGSVYVILIALVIGTISLANLLYARWQIPRYVVQPAIYALTAVIGLYLHLRHTVSYRYTLTDTMFAIERLAAKGETTMTATPLGDILGIENPIRARHRGTRVTNASVLPRRSSVLVYIRENGTETAYRISPSEDFIAILAAQCRTAQMKEES